MDHTKGLPSFSAALTLGALPEPCMLKLLSPLSRDRKLAMDAPLSPCLTLVCLSMLSLELDVFFCSYMLHHCFSSIIAQSQALQDPGHFIASNAEQ